MTSPDQPVQPSEDAHELTEGPPEPSVEAQEPATQPSLPPHKSAWLRAALSVTAFVGLSAVLIGVLIVIGTHPDKSSGPPIGVAPGTTTTSGGNAVHAAPNGISNTKGNVISPAKLAESGGALSLPVGMQKPVVGWQLGPGGTHLAAVSRLFGDALQAGGLRQYPEMRVACTQLAGSAASAEAGPKIPDAAMQALYARALAELVKGATDCRAAIRLSGDESVEAHVDSTLLRLSMSELAVGARDIFRSTAEIEIVSRQQKP